MAPPDTKRTGGGATHPSDFCNHTFPAPLTPYHNGQWFTARLYVHFPPCSYDAGFPAPCTGCHCSVVFFSLQSLCLTHTGKPMGVAVSHCITWFQTQLIPTMCQIRDPSHLWDHCSTGQL